MAAVRTGARRHLPRAGLRWKRLRDPVTVVGEMDAAAREACWELSAMTVASLVP
ncbi:hypothetical protein [Frankia sp. Cas3]|uniref:hypothetical protein n=1 Tax=Frankia sp. Cas3 TaxID=3073926 RepID=UPI003A0FE70D